MKPILTAAAFVATMASAGQAFAQYQWASDTYDDGTALQGGWLVFGVPQTDDMRLSADCNNQRPGEIELRLYVDTGPNDPGSDVEATFAVGDSVIVLPASVLETGMGRYGQITLDGDDELWQVLMDGRAGSIGLTDGAWSDFNLSGSHAAISAFLARCAEVAPAVSDDVNADADVQPLAGPLYVVVPYNATMYADFQGGPSIGTIVENTEVMSTNTYGSHEGVEYIQVATARGEGSPFWIELSALRPVSGGATEYQNLNRVANLLVRNAPSGTGDPVGGIPPLATGIEDLGQRNGEWVYVRYGNMTGWASHTYLAPIVPVDAPNRGSYLLGAGLPGALVVGYGSWIAECDPCRHPEDGGTCQLISGYDNLTFDVHVGDANPLLMRYYLTTSLPEPTGSDDVLELIVDGETAHTIVYPDWFVEGLTGGTVIDDFSPYFDALLNGQMLRIVNSSPAGSEVDDFPLDGLPQAYQALLDNGPVENLHGSSPSCPIQ